MNYTRERDFMTVEFSHQKDALKAIQNLHEEEIGQNKSILTLRFVDEAAKDQICFSFLNTGDCKYGTECFYRHEANPKDSENSFD